MGFEWAYRSGTPPWDIGRAQPAVVGLAEDGLITGEVLDAGCGTGENALYLAGRGLAVTGVDASPTAIERARAKAGQRAISADFVVADALALAGLGRTFDAVVDCGLFHVFDDADRRRYERNLRAVVRSDGRYFLLCFSDREPGEGGPRRVSQAEIRRTFARGWRVDEIVATRFAVHEVAGISRAPHAWLASLTRLPESTETG